MIKKFLFYLLFNIKRKIICELINEIKNKKWYDFYYSTFIIKILFHKFYYIYYNFTTSVLKILLFKEIKLILISNMRNLIHISCKKIDQMKDVWKKDNTYLKQCR